ncbi:MAG: Bug family tripartite tricarboxylate transporter substrate binding protein [Burkholderiales bacterium]
MKHIISTAIAVAACAPLLTSAQGFPERPVRVVVAAAPGGGSDFVGRVVSQKVSDTVGKPFVIDNRGGAAGVLGADLVAKAAPDGYTLMVIFANFSTFPSLGKKLPFDVISDFAPVSNMAAGPLILVVNPSTPVKSVADLIESAKSRPGGLSYAAPGVGSMGHLAAEQFRLMTKAPMEQIAYKGGGPAVTALLGNEVQLYFSTPPAALVQVKAGRLRALAVTGPKRSPIAPELPTIAESGLPGYSVVGWFGVFAPAKTPRAIVETLSRQYAAAVQQKDIEQRLTAEGLEPVGSAPAELADQLRNDVAKWGKVIREAGIRVE